jgi:hypothetical protein
MLRIFSFCIYFVLSISLVFSQSVDQNPALRYSELISSDSIKSYLYILASDSLEGRETGMYGQKLAADFLSNKYQQFGLEYFISDKPYQHPFNLVNKNFKNSSVLIDSDTLVLKEDYFFFPKNDFVNIEANEMVFLSYGIEDANYSNLSIDVNIIKDKIVVILDGEPMKGKKYLISKSKEKSEWSLNINKKLNLLTELQAKAVFIVADDYEKRSRIVRYIVERPRLYLEEDAKESELLPTFFVSPAFLEKYFNLKNNHKNIDKNNGLVINKNVKINLDFVINKIETENIVAYIPGTKEEYIVISSHFDHLGKDSEGNIYNGADDNASGTSAVLELSRVFKQAYTDGYIPEKGLIFMNVSGEEKGLLGSDFYTRQPIIPLENTVANLNIDMVGRFDKRYNENDKYIYLIGADKISKKLHDISEQANDEFTQLKLDYKFNDEGDPNRFYYRSDHYNFAKNNVPVIFYFSGVHQDYHKPEDTADKINYNLLSERTKLVFHTAWKLAYTKDLKLKE